MKNKFLNDKNIKIVNIIGWHIGNRGTIGEEAIKAIYDCEIILCEVIDTSGGQTKWWKNHDFKLENFMIENEHKLIDYLEVESANGFEDILNKYNKIGIMSFEGLPGLADPAHTFLKIAYKRDDVRVIITPSPDAVSSSMAVSGFDSNGYVFAGFPQDNKKLIRNTLEKFYTSTRGIPGLSIIMFFKDYMLKEMLESVIEVFGPDEYVAICINLSRKDSRIAQGKASQLIQTFFIKDTEDYELNKCTIVIKNNNDPS
jgi:16S rRNA C1402 (ribose-2'-O) methylase RsmI